MWCKSLESPIITACDFSAFNLSINYLHHNDICERSILTMSIYLSISSGLKWMYTCRSSAWRWWWQYCSFVDTSLIYKGCGKSHGNNFFFRRYQSGGKMWHIQTKGQGVNYMCVHESHWHIVTHEFIAVVYRAIWPSGCKGMTTQYTWHTWA